MHLQFDYTKCIKCGQCMQACGSHHIQLDADGKPYLKNVLQCGDCGNCMAICPVDAVVNTRMDITQFQPMEDPNINFTQYLHLVRNRRSIRKFRPEPVKAEHLEKLLQSVHYIPTGSNKQALKYLIIASPEKIQSIKTAMARKFKTVHKLATSFPIKLFVKKEDQASLGRLVEMWESGEDPYLRDAPCLMLIYSDENYFGITSWDSGIACYNMNLAAETIGLGVLQNGFFVTTARLFKSIKKLTGLPKKMTILGALCLGYPVLKFRKTVARKPLDVKYV